MDSLLPVLVWLVTPAGVLFLGGLEVREAFESAPEVWLVCKKRLALGAAGLVAWGLACYLSAWLLNHHGGFQLGGGPPPDLAMAIGAIGAAQTARVEALKKTDIHGSPSPPGDRESLYAKFIRMFLADVYRGLVQNLHDPATVAPIVRRGLVAAYELATMSEEFATWAHTRTPQERDTHLSWARAVLANTLASDREKRSSLAQRMIDEDLAAARRLAVRRAPAIVDQRAI